MQCNSNSEDKDMVTSDAAVTVNTLQETDTSELPIPLNTPRSMTVEFTT